MGKKLTYEYVKNYIEIESESECKLISDIYMGNKINLLVKCKCGNIFSVAFNTFVTSKKQQCNDCGYAVTSTKKTKSKDIFIKETEIFSDEYTFLDEYKKSTEKIKVLHKVCGHIYSVKPNDFLSGYRCPLCGGTKRKTHEEFILKIRDLVGYEYTVIGEYHNGRTKLPIRHNKCGYVWNATPECFLGGNRCPKCSGLMKKTHQEFLKEVHEIHYGMYKIISEYKGNASKVKVMCIKCDQIWITTPNKLQCGYGCPKCKASKGEKRIIGFLYSHNLDYIHQSKFEDCKKISQLPFDFSINNKDGKMAILIEYDGIQHFEPVAYFGGVESFKENKLRDQIKNDYCIKNNIPLLRIPYWDYDNIESILKIKLTELGLIHSKNQEVI